MNETLDQLASMTKHELLEFWLEELPDPAPKKLSPDHLPWEIAWRLQVRDHGDLSKRTKQKLKGLGEGVSQ